MAPGSCEISRKTMWDLTFEVNKDQRFALLCTHVQTVVSCDELNKDQKKKISTFLFESRRRLDNVGRLQDVFLDRYKEWLECCIDFSTPKDTESPTPSTVNPGPGRPEKPFSESSERSKRRKVSALVAKHPPEALAQAVQSGLRRAGKADSAHVLQQVTETTPTRGTKIRKAYDENQKKPLKKYTSEEALGLLIDLRLTKDRYKKLRRGARERNHDLHPSYDVLYQAKLSCYSPQTTVTITEISAEITLQGLLDKTTERLFQSLDIESWTEKKGIVLISKYGFDGSSGHSEYHQLLDEVGNDRFMFLSSLVPLRFKCEDGVLWTNESANSTRFCRPIRFRMVQETPEVIKEEHSYIEEQISSLQPSSVSISNGCVVSVSREVVLSMIDGKVVRTLCGTSSARCPNCKATPKEMNNISVLLQKEIDETSLLLGLSPLHAHIRMLEYLLHVSYRMELKMWSVTGKENQARMEVRKKCVQERFRLEMGGLRVDMVKQGAGTTNDGNTARRVFANPTLAADILGIDREKVERVAIILVLFSIQKRVKLNELRLYSLATYKLIVEKIPWYYVPQSVHRMLLHGHQILKECTLPVGMLSEEPQEARNKDYSYFRKHHTRKISRLATNQDLLNMMMVSSDPVISQIYSKDKSCKRRSEFPDAVKKMLEDSSSESESSDESD